MTSKLAVFYFLAAFTVWAGAVVVLGKNIVRAAVALIFSFCGFAALFVLLDAEFLAAVQVLIYVGGITILLLFAIMLTSRISVQTVRVINDQVFLSALAGLGILAGLAYASLKETGKNPIKHPRHFKSAELKTRALLRQLANFREDISIEDQPALDKVKAIVEKVHDDLLIGIMERKK